MIAPGCGIVALAHAAAAQAAPFRVHLGDVPTWITGIAAVLAWLSAVYAYRQLKQQVKLQGDALQDQQKANSLQARLLAREQANKVDLTSRRTFQYALPTLKPVGDATVSQHSVSQSQRKPARLTR